MLKVRVLGSSFFEDQVKNILEDMHQFVYTDYTDKEKADVVIIEGKKKKMSLSGTVCVRLTDEGVFLDTGNFSTRVPGGSISSILCTVVAMAGLIYEQKEHVDLCKSKIKEYVEEYHENEINQNSSRIVQLMVARESTNIKGFESELIYVPKAHVSGDFIMVQELPGKVFIFFGDVTGHGSYGGTYGAVLTSLAKGYLMNASPMQANIESLAGYMKDAAFFYHGGAEQSSAECVLCEINLEKDTASFVTFGGGGTSPIVIRPDGKLITVFDEHNADKILVRMGDAIYQEEDMDFPISSVRIEHFTVGNGILFYTDGVTELFSSKKSGKDFLYTYGPENMTKTISDVLSSGYSSPNDIVKAVVNDMVSYGIQGLDANSSLSDMISDDSTIYCIRRAE